MLDRWVDSPSSPAAFMAGLMPAARTLGVASSVVCLSALLLVAGSIRVSAQQTTTQTSTSVRERRANAKRRAARAAAAAATPGDGAGAKSTAANKEEAESGAATEMVPRAERAADGEDSSGVKNVTGAKTEAGVEADAAVENAEEVVVAAGGEVEALKARLKDAKTNTERARVQRDLINLLVGSDRKAYAVNELRAMLDEERFDPTGLYNIGNALARLGESSAAADAYRKAIGQRHGNYARAQNNLGVVLIRLGRWDEAQEALTAALRLESNSYPEASYNLGRMYALRGEAGLAINAWARALAQQSDHTDVAVALARALAEDGDTGRGLAVLDAFDKRMALRGVSSPRAIALARGEIVAAANVVAASAAGAKGSAALKSPSSKTDDGETRDPEGAGRRARLPRAASTPLRALAVDQQSYDLLQRAREAREAGRNEEAATLYRRVIRKRGGYFPPANLELGYALTSLQRNEEAVASFLPVATRDGARYPIAFYHLGRLYEHLGQLPRAVEAFSRAASLYGQENPQFFIDLSRVREKEGNTRAALDAMASYVEATERTGGAPAWARERLAKLRQTDAATPPAPTRQTTVSTKP